MARLQQEDRLLTTCRMTIRTQGLKKQGVRGFRHRRQQLQTTQEHKPSKRDSFLDFKQCIACSKDDNLDERKSS